MKDLKTNIYFKIGAIVIIALLLLIPTSMIKKLVRERESRQQGAIQEVSLKWGEQQTITGPILSIPYYKSVKKESRKDSEAKYLRTKEFIHLLPEQLDINGKITPEKRHRGIYNIVVYESDIHFSGHFNIDVSKLDIAPKNILFNNAFISIGIDDLRGIEKQIELQWNNSTIQFNPGTVTNDIVSTGVNAPVPFIPDTGASIQYALDLNLKGSQFLYFVPVGKVTRINLNSNWNNPSFNGAFLPDDHTTNNEGFKAEWHILNLNRNFPQVWTGDKYDLNESAFGVDLLLPVDSYQKSTRSVKYAILFIALTFLVFFFVEIMKKMFIHPVQYILVGLALIIFYSLLISLSEHVHFNTAYIVSAVLTLLLIFGYVRAILKSSSIASIVGGILFILYTFIFVIIQLQNYSLLIGSVGLFIILGLVMYFTRKIDWYNINMELNRS